MFKIEIYSFKMNERVTRRTIADCYEIISENSFVT